MNGEDAAWLAGIFEGEGCFHISKGGFAVATICMTDRDVIERVNDLFACSKIGCNAHNRKPLWIWRISREAQLREFIAIVLPQLGERRTKKALEVLAYLDTLPGQGSHNRNKTHCKHGHEFTPENTYIPATGVSAGKRYCRACGREYYWRHKRGECTPRLILPTCTEDGCEGKPFANGLCQKHYMRWYRRTKRP